MAKSGVHKVGEVFWLRRRVPARYSGIDKRREVRLSLKTDSLSVAESKARALWAEMEEGWEATLRMGSGDALARFEAAKDIAGRRGFEYLPLGGVSALPARLIADRVMAISGPVGCPDKSEAEALLGAVDVPAMTVSEALAAFWPLTVDRHEGSSPQQIKSWEDPRKKAIATFVDVVGDLSMSALTREHFLQFRSHLLDRVRDREDKFKAASANKDIMHLQDVLGTVNDLKDLRLDLRMEKLKIKEDEQKPRPPFSTAWIRDRLLAPGALDGLNDEARAVVEMMMNTGARPSEICALTRETLKLDANVPHIVVTNEGRKLKSKNARRKLPLIGVALEAARRHPDGFPNYRDKANSLSATVGKYLRTNGLLETPDHVLYSLRHSFSDRMVNGGIDERIRHDLMGHTLKHVRYGEGASLEYLVELLKPISFPATSPT